MPAKKSTNVQISHHSWTAEIEGGSPIDTAWDNSKIIPTKATAQWYESEGGPKFIRVDGLKLKKDGSVGKMMGFQNFFMKPTRGERGKPAPAWLRNIFDARDINPANG